MSIPRKHHYSQLLKEILLDRVSANSRYSMRAFAKHIGVSASQLSRVINGNRALSSEAAEEVGIRLFDCHGNVRNFMELVSIGNRPSSSERDQLEEILFKQLRPENVMQLNEEKLKCLFSWSVPACFDALGLMNGPRSNAELGALFGLSETEVSRNLEMLVRAGLIRRAGRWYERITANFSAGGAVPSTLIRNLHRQYIGRALAALDGQPLEKRYFRSKTLNVNAKYLGEIRAKIETLCADFERFESLSQGSCDSVYQVNVQLFDLLDRSVSPKEKKNAG